MNKQTRDTKVLLFYKNGLPDLQSMIPKPAKGERMGYFWCLKVFEILVRFFFLNFILIFLTVMRLQHTKQYSLYIKDTF